MPMIPPNAPRTAKMAADKTSPSKSPAIEIGPSPRLKTSFHSEGVSGTYSLNRSMIFRKSANSTARNGMLKNNRMKAAKIPVNAPTTAPSPAFKETGESLAARKEARMAPPIIHRQHRQLRSGIPERIPATAPPMSAGMNTLGFWPFILASSFSSQDRPILCIFYHAMQAPPNRSRNRKAGWSPTECPWPGGGYWLSPRDPKDCRPYPRRWARRRPGIFSL